MKKIINLRTHIIIKGELKSLNDALKNTENVLADMRNELDEEIEDVKKKYDDDIKEQERIKRSK